MRRRSKVISPAIVDETSFEEVAPIAVDPPEAGPNKDLEAYLANPPKIEPKTPKGFCKYCERYVGRGIHFHEKHCQHQLNQSVLMSQTPEYAGGNSGGISRKKGNKHVGLRDHEKADSEGD